MRTSFIEWLAVLAAAAMAVAQPAEAVEIQETSTLPPAFTQKAAGPMARADTALRQLIGEFLAHRERAEPGPFTPSNPYLQYAPGRVVIDAVAAGDPARLDEDLRGLGMRKVARYGPIVSGLVPIGAIESMMRLDSLHSVRASWRPITNVGLVTSEGVEVMGVTSMGVRLVPETGNGVMIGVLSDSYDHLGDAASDQINDDLPANVVSLDDSGNCGSIIYPAPCRDEGRAMMQLAHDVAPGADMAFHTAFTGIGNFAQGIRDLAAAGADVIVDDIIYLAEPMFQDGVIAQAVDEVAAGGVAYFSAAGNSARNSYEAPYRQSSETLYVSGLFGGLEYRGELHDFDPDPAVEDWRQGLTIPAGQTVQMVMQWDEPSSAVAPGNGSCSDLDIYLVTGPDHSMSILASSIANNMDAPCRPNDADGSGEPVEILSYTNSSGSALNADILIAHFDGPHASLLKYVMFGGHNVIVEDDAMNSPTIYGHANAAGAEAVGATFYKQTPIYDPAYTQPLLEWFSSAGGISILFDVNGNRLSVPDLREKPGIVGPDGANTTFFYADSPSDEDTDPNFFGTSAASPHVAAVAALMKEANPGASPAEIFAALENTALEMMDPGFDWDSGYGFVSAPDAVAAVGAGGPTDPPPENQTPVADAGADQIVTISGGSASALLDGSNSSDPDCQPEQACPLTFHWTILSKPRKATTSLSEDQSTGIATFITDKAGTYEFELSVSDGIASSTDTVVVTVEKPPKTSGGGGGGGDCNPNSPKCNSAG